MSPPVSPQVDVEADKSCNSWFCCNCFRKAKTPQARAEPHSVSPVSVSATSTRITEVVQTHIHKGHQRSPSVDIYGTPPPRPANPTPPSPLEGKE